MLVLSRKLSERIALRIPAGTVIPDGGLAIEVMVADIRGERVRIGIEAPTWVGIHRQEVQDAIDRGEEPKFLHQPLPTSH